MIIRTMSITDYADIMALFHATPGIRVRGADSEEAIAAYLQRNPQLSFVAQEDAQLIGCVMSGHDGRRGFLHHLVVHPDFRKRGIGEQLVTSCLDGLAAVGIDKTHIFVIRDNHAGNAFWVKRGWQLRSDINMLSFNRSADLNA